RPSSSTLFPYTTLFRSHIRHFATHPDFLRKGVARRLLDHCLAQAATQGVRLMKSNSTLPAQAFYAAAGFVRVREIEVEMAPGAQDRKSTRLNSSHVKIS